MFIIYTVDRQKLAKRQKNMQKNYDSFNSNAKYTTGKKRQDRIWYRELDGRKSLHTGRIYSLCPVPFHQFDFCLSLPLYCMTIYFLFTIGFSLCFFPVSLGFPYRFNRVAASSFCIVLSPDENWRISFYMYMKMYLTSSVFLLIFILLFHYSMLYG